MSLVFERQRLNLSVSSTSLIYHREYSGKLCNEPWITQRLNYAKNLYSFQLYSHFGCVNAIEFSDDGRLMTSGGDDSRVLLWSVSKCLFNRNEKDHKKMYEPIVMSSKHMSNIFCLKINSTNDKILSGGNDDQVLLHDIESRRCVNIYSHEKPVYCISLHPSDRNVFATACEDGRILMYDVRKSTQDDFTCLARMRTPFFSVMHNPVKENFLVTANSRSGICIWDCRFPKKIYHTFGNVNDSGMSACYSQDGEKVLALRRRLSPILYATNNPKVKIEFSHSNYYNSCTMKSCSFAGQNDEYITSGSDDFNIYVWKIPEKLDDSGDKIRDTHMILKGHRSIVNQVRYCKRNVLLASSGVEKIIKLWTPLPLDDCEGSLSYCNSESTRTIYTQQEYYRLARRQRSFFPHDYSALSTSEDPVMLAFFDSLIQRDTDGWVYTPSDVSLDGDPYQSESSSSNSSFDTTEEEQIESERLAFLVFMKRRKMRRIRAKHRLAQKKLLQKTSQSNKKVVKYLIPDVKKVRKFKNNVHIKVPVLRRQIIRKPAAKKGTFQSKSGNSLECCNNNGILDGPSTSTGITQNSKPKKLLQLTSSSSSVCSSPSPVRNLQQNGNRNKRLKFVNESRRKLLRLYNSSDSETDLPKSKSDNQPKTNDTNTSSVFKKRTLKKFNSRKPITVPDSNSDSNSDSD